MFFLAATLVGWIDFVYRKVAAKNTSTWPFLSLLAEVPPHFLSLQARSHFHATCCLVHSYCTLGVIGVGSPEGAWGRGDQQRPPDAFPGRLRTAIASSWQSVDSMVMARPKRRVVARRWQRGEGGGERPCTTDGQPQDARPENRPRRRGRMGAKRPRWPGLPRREARGGFSRPFPPFRNYFRFCKSTSSLTPTSIRTLFPYYTGF